MILNLMPCVLPVLSIKILSVLKSSSNKLNIGKKSISTELYDHIINAENCNVIILSGTPLINYP